MAGVKGRSGGARPNSGGKREGAGRKPAPPVFIQPDAVAPTEPDSIRLLRQITNDVSLDAKLRLDAAKALAPFEAVRKGESGKKEERAEAARKAGTGKFGRAAPPKLVVNNH